MAIEHAMWDLLEKRGAEYPAEHNVGHLYNSKPALVDHYKKLDACNCFNRGIGHTSKRSRWQMGRAPEPRAAQAKRSQNRTGRAITRLKQFRQPLQTDRNSPIV